MTPAEARASAVSTLRDLATDEALGLYNLDPADDGDGGLPGCPVCNPVIDGTERGRLACRRGLPRTPVPDEVSDG